MGNANRLSIASVSPSRTPSGTACPVICMKPTSVAAASTAWATAARSAGVPARNTEMSMTGTSRTPSTERAELLIGLLLRERMRPAGRGAPPKGSGSQKEYRCRLSPCAMSRPASVRRSGGRSGLDRPPHHQQHLHRPVVHQQPTVPHQTWVTDQVPGVQPPRSVALELDIEAALDDIQGHLTLRLEPFLQVLAGLDPVLDELQHA